MGCPECELTKQQMSCQYGRFARRSEPHIDEHLAASFCPLSGRTIQRTDCEKILSNLASHKPRARFAWIGIAGSQLETGP